MDPYFLEFFTNQDFSPAWTNFGIVLLGNEDLWKMSEFSGSWKNLGHYLHA